MSRILRGSYREVFSTSNVTTVAAHTASAGHLLALRNKAAPQMVAVLKAIEVEFLLTTAFGSAQEVGFSAYLLRAYLAAHSGATALTVAGGQRTAADAPPQLTGWIADTGALTAGTHTIDTNPIARGSCYASAVGAQVLARRYDFMPFGGFELGDEEGMLISNTVVMGAAGVGKWHFTVEWDEYRIV
jgi:hypothetical protein